MTSPVIRSAAACLLALVLLSTGNAARAILPDDQRDAKAEVTPEQVETATLASLPALRDAVQVRSATNLNSRGWHPTSASLPRSDVELPNELLDAYWRAVTVAPASCRVDVPLLAAIGQVESNNLEGLPIDEAGTVVPPLIGPPLDGSPYSAFPDTDAGLLDTDKKWDRALGPMQLVPAAWRLVGVDMDVDGVRDPQNAYDAAGGAMVYLCAGSRDLADAADVNEAVLAYNGSRAYLREVLAWRAAFEKNDQITGFAPVTATMAMALGSFVSQSEPASARPTALATTAPALVGTTTPVPASASGVIPVSQLSPSPSASPIPSAPGTPGATPTPGSTPAAGSGSTPGSTPGSAPGSTPGATPDPTPSTPSTPDPGPTTSPDPTPAPPPAQEPPPASEPPPAQDPPPPPPDPTPDPTPTEPPPTCPTLTPGTELPELPLGPDGLPTVPPGCPTLEELALQQETVAP